ncbi:MAG: hypothetical protein QOE54_4667 [Streptosporangiaceae bacterium]|jgi:hypothetical protein|nr:hypothetical protein [Streptosporangiaceae bacterium]MDX6432301.1 hypothetical protein [Streptosporangiaceae bacterium]
MVDRDDARSFLESAFGAFKNFADAAESEKAGRPAGGSMFRAANSLGQAMESLIDMTRSVVTSHHRPGDMNISGIWNSSGSAVDLIEHDAATSRVVLRLTNSSGGMNVFTGAASADSYSVHFLISGSNSAGHLIVIEGLTTDGRTIDTSEVNSVTGDSGSTLYHRA